MNQPELKPVGQLANRRRPPQKRKRSRTPLVLLFSVPIIVICCLVFPMLFSGNQQKGESTVLSTAVALYAEPDRGSEVLVTLPEGSTVYLTQTAQERWSHLVTNDGLSGYVRSDLSQSRVPTSAASRHTPFVVTPYKVPGATLLFRRPNTTSRVLSHIESGEEIELLGILKNDMVKARTADGNMGYIEKTVVDEDTLKTQTAELEQTVSTGTDSVFNLFDTQYTSMTFQEKMSFLRKTFPEGKYWNSLGANVDGLSQDWEATVVTDSPCVHEENGYEYCHEYNGKTLELFDYDSNIQCLAFASVISDFLFGKDTEITTFTDFSDLNPGDHIRNIELEHSMVVISVGDGSVTVVSCNNDYENCQIHWDQVVTEEDLEGYDVLYYTRS